MLLLIDVALFTLSLLLAVVLVLWGQRLRRKRMRQAQAELDRTRLTVAGDPLGAFLLRGKVEGVDISLECQTSVKRPGQGASEGGYLFASVVRLPVPLPDLIVCRSAEVDGIMGPLPSAPRARTGHAPFDTAFSVYLSPTLAGGQAGDFLTSKATSLAWAHPRLLERMTEMELHWIRIQHGEAQLVFPPTNSAGAERISTLGVAFGRAARGEAFSLPHGDGPIGPRMRHIDVKARVLAVVGISALVALSAGWGVAFIPALWGLDQELLCGPSDPIIEVSCGEGGCLGCKSDPERFMGLHYVASMGFAAGVTMLVGLGVVARQTLRARRQEV